MRASSLFFSLVSILVYPAIISSVVLYIYPLFTGCEFPRPHKRQESCSPSSSINSADDYTLPKVAPFRLLAFGDPQLEGDSSLPNPDGPLFYGLAHLQSFDWSTPREYSTQILHNNYDVLRKTAHQILRYDIPRLAWSNRKRLDLWGNDYYLAHIYRTLHWWLQPTHVTVLGDLLGSQWISDEEFDQRSWRFWNRVFRNGSRVEDAITNYGGGRSEALGEDAQWKTRVITLPGNHDVGYAGDMTHERMERFEREFGKTNWDVTFTIPSDTQLSESLDSRFAQLVTGGPLQPSIRLVTLNSMNLDGPVHDSMSQEKTYAYLNSAIARSPSFTHSNNTLTVVLTHIPLHKPEGVCTDGPYFSYHEDGGIREQNHLSRTASASILEGLLGMSGNVLTPGGGLGRKGLILTGHDHEGCDVYHHVLIDAPRDGEEWTAVPWDSIEGQKARAQTDVAGVREVTLRSMMGEFGGNAGLVSAWYDEQAGEWQVEVAKCAAGVQHIWWAIHGLDLAVIGTLVASCISWIIEALGDWKARRQRARRRAGSNDASRTRSKSRTAMSQQRRLTDGHGSTRRKTLRKRLKADE